MDISKHYNSHDLNVIRWIVWNAGLVSGSASYSISILSIVMMFLVPFLLKRGFKRELRVVFSILVIGYCIAVCFSFLFVYRMRHLLMSQYYDAINNYPQQMLSCTDAFDEAFFGVKNGWYWVPKLDDIKKCVDQAEANLLGNDQK